MMVCDLDGGQSPLGGARYPQIKLDAPGKRPQRYERTKAKVAQVRKGARAYQSSRIGPNTHQVVELVDNAFVSCERRPSE
jgi:hypothetical protein